ncbi:hypothetical protein Vadar_006280 [Vaccinium darrowii]|uniref:Uncharacterized protein n=1 Tax=Vaccinium darrowii TaxID=229202 RepID=A0ACB7YJQ9_9ERIC|nr:hypothetical protein Vadar_006280 [Vaccinium darrowii]
MCTPQCIFDKLGGLAFDEAVKQGKYVLHYAKNLEKLQDEMRKLDDRRERIHIQVCEAIDNGKAIVPDVKTWQMEADKLKSDVDQLMGESSAKGNMHCIACSCPNIKWRFRLSKQAKKNIQDVKELIEKGHFNEISHRRRPPPELESLSNKNYVNFDSRRPIFNKIVHALEESGVNMIGVHGPGGVGKTTLVKEVCQKMLDDRSFKRVSLAVVSKDLNVKDIQSKLADSLNFDEFDATAEEKSRATQLWNKFTNGEKYLIVLDDIWEEVDLKAIGIPIMDGKTGCKVLLTSRNEDLLVNRMCVDIPFPMAELSEAEAWVIFKKRLGNSIESQPEIESLAREVCKKCKGLPIAINALGAALKDKPDYAWKDALNKLERCMLTNIQGVKPSVWVSLRLSYDMLWSLDAKCCFLLCCLFREDAEIPIGDLTRHCLASRLLSQNPRTLEEVRNSVCTVIDALKSASLLSTGSHENVVRIHDIIRDVGISIAREEKAFFVDHGALCWPENPIDRPPYSTISLISGKIKALPTELTCPKLRTLMFESNQLSDLKVPDEFFSEMTQLSVLTLTRMHMKPLPSSLGKLANLRMLHLIECHLANIAILGDLNKNLEVLSLRGSSIMALPPEIGQLTSLRVLDLEECDKLSMIPQGVVSNLTNLEELYFPDTFDKWEAPTNEKHDISRSSNVSLEELRQSLTRGQSTILHIHIPKVMLLPEGLKFENLKRFRVSVGSKFNRSEDFPGTRVLKYDRIPLRNEFIPLMDKAEVLYLNGIKGLKKVLHDGGVRNGFLNLKNLKVTSCDDDLEYLLREPKSSVQSHGQVPLQSFSKLTMLLIDNCKLKYLFSPTTTRGLVHLEQLEVRSCEIIEGIVGFEGQNDVNEHVSEVKFGKLKQLILKNLPNLISFYVKKKKTGTTMRSSFALPQPLFNEKLQYTERVEFREGSHFSFVVCNLSFGATVGVGSRVWAANLLEFCVAAILIHIQCHCLVATTLEVAFPALECLIIDYLPTITKIWDKKPLPESEKETQSFCKLGVISMEGCNHLVYVLPSYMLPRLQNLQKIAIFHCEEMEVIISKELKENEAADNDIIVFRQLKELTFWNVPKLKSLYTGAQVFFSDKVRH